MQILQPFYLCTCVEPGLRGWCAGGGLGCCWAQPAAGMAVEIYNFSNFQAAEFTLKCCLAARLRTTILRSSRQGGEHRSINHMRPPLMLSTVCGCTCAEWKGNAGGGCRHLHFTLPPQPARVAGWQPALWIRVSFKPQILQPKLDYIKFLPYNQN